MAQLCGALASVLLVVAGGSFIQPTFARAAVPRARSRVFFPDWSGAGPARRTGIGSRAAAVQDGAASGWSSAQLKLEHQQRQQQQQATTTTTNNNNNNSNNNNWKRRLLPDRASCGQNRKKSLANRIVGGEEAGLGEFPWLALIGYKRKNEKKNSKNYDDYNDYDEPTTTAAPVEDTEIKFDCGGTLISERFVVTAAHCVEAKHGDIVTIRLGEHNLEQDRDCEVSGYNRKIECNDLPLDIAPERIMPHRQYNRPHRDMNDIALIRLSQPVSFTKWISPICLPFGDGQTDNLSGDAAIVAGFGFTEMFGETSPTLQKLTVPIVNWSDCRSMYSGLIVKIHKTLQLCAGGIVGQDSCQGDSGGPLMTQFGPQVYLIGVTSFGSVFCGQKPVPGVYTSVARYLDWVLDRIY